MKKYLKTVDFLNKKKNTHYVQYDPLEYRQRIRRHMTLKIKVKVIIH